jgi:hypothetical protein
MKSLVIKKSFFKIKLNLAWSKLDRWLFNYFLIEYCSLGDIFFSVATGIFYKHEGHLRFASITILGKVRNV